MSRLRSVLGPAADRIRSDSGGYRLDIGPEESDLTRVERLLRDGRAALGLNDLRHAGELFTAALALWNGDALDDLANFPLHAAAARRVRELHFTVYEARNDAFLADGRHLEVLADIDEWVRAEPLREHLRGQQIAALYRSGRQADALRECADLRAQLRDALGVDPSTGIQELERRVLDQDPSLLATRAGLSVPLPAWTSETLSFVGRRDALDFAMAALRRACVDGMRLVVVEGEAGVGKSRFLLEFARSVRDDAIVLPVDIHESLRPSATALTQTLKMAAAAHDAGGPAAHARSLRRRRRAAGRRPVGGRRAGPRRPVGGRAVGQGAGRARRRRSRPRRTHAVAPDRAPLGDRRAQAGARARERAAPDRDERTPARPPDRRARSPGQRRRSSRSTRSTKATSTNSSRACASIPARPSPRSCTS